MPATINSVIEATENSCEELSIKISATDGIKPYSLFVDDTLIDSDWDGTETNIIRARNASYDIKVIDFNNPPIVDAGPDLLALIGLHRINAFILITDATVSDNDGTIDSIFWEEISDTEYNENSYDDSRNELSPTFYDLILGSYTFQITVTDNGGKTVSDTMDIIVRNSPQAGNDREITLPTNSVIINNARIATTDEENNTDITWTQASGPNTSTITNSDTITPTFSDLIEGVYTFEITITSTITLSSGNQNTETRSDQMIVTVNPDLSPSINAGDDREITLPTNSVTIGSFTEINEGDRTLESINWTQTSGPNTSIIDNSDTIRPTFSDLIEGDYVFQMTVTFSNNETLTDEMIVTVNPEPIRPPSISAGRDKHIELPTNSITIGDPTINENESTLETISWTQASGPNDSTITNSDTISPTFSDLIKGDYAFQMTVTFNNHDTLIDEIKIRVFSEMNTHPGSNREIELPTNSVTIDDAIINEGDGTLESISWTQRSGPNDSTITDSDTISPTFSDLIEGDYAFEMLTKIITTLLSGTTSRQTTEDLVYVTVNPDPLPSISAGPDREITLPTESITIFNAAIYEGNRTLESISWAQTSGPNDSFITSSDTTSPIFTGLIEGDYFFQMTVIFSDNFNDNETFTDELKVTVNSQ